MKKLILLTALFYFACKSANAQPGRPDPSFGNNGIVKADLGADFNYSTEARQVLIGPDKGMYIILDGPTFIYKRHPDGSADSSYGLNGFSSSVPLTYNHAAIQPDGKIIIVGNEFSISQFAISRIDTNGSPDVSFGNNGIRSISFNPRAVAVMKDGKIIVAGGDQDGFVVSRYNMDGSPDNSFSGDGTLITDFPYKIPPDKGDDDSTVLHSGIANTIIAQPDGKIIVAGAANTTASPNFPVFAVARYNGNGTLDDTFDGDGKQETRIGSLDDIGYSLGLQSDGKIVLAGYSNDGTRHRFSLVRYKVNGQPDNSFNGTGKQILNLGSDAQVGNSVAIESDGKIVVAGYTLTSVNNGFFNNDFAVARFNSNGTLDHTFSSDGILTTDFGSTSDYAASLAIQEDKKILVAGYSFNPANQEQFVVSRYNANGSPDNSFDNDGKLVGDYRQGNTEFNSGVALADGKILAAGQTWNGKNYDFALARYTIDGRPDSTFSDDGIRLTNFGANDVEPKIAVQNDGKVLLAGSTLSNNVLSAAISRYNTDGTTDSTFNGSGKLTTNFGAPSENGNAIALQKDGKIVVAGDDVIGRFNKNGGVDSSFGLNGVQTTTHLSFTFICQAMAIQNDGKIIVTGFTSNDAAIMRLNANGGFDSTFDGDGIVAVDFGLTDEDASSVAIQNDGKIIIAGGGRGSEGLSLIARYRADGTPDASFSGDGKQTVSNGYVVSVIVQGNGKIIAAGKLNDNSMVLTRFNTDGSVDKTFGDNGEKTTRIGTSYGKLGAAFIGSNKLYVAGSARFPGYLGVVERYFLNTSEVPPVINLITPADNATYLSGGNVYLNAAAADANGTIVKVEFFNGTTLLHTATDTPYTFKWEHVQRGNYTIIARATDNSGLTAVDSAHISVVPNKPPAVKITNPLDGQTFLRGATVHLQASATDVDGRITGVEFYSGTILLATEHKAPYTFDWKIGTAGSYKITARATDNWGAVTVSSPVTISVVPNKAPVVSIVTPSNGQTFTAPATINIRATAQDPDGTIMQVAFYNGTTLLTTEHKSPYTYQWKNVRAGTYTITAVAKDNWSAVTTSAPVRVTVKASGKAQEQLSVADAADAVNDAISLQLAPNPVTNILNIRTTGVQRNKQTSVSIISSSGVIMRTMQPGPSTQTIQFDVSTLPRGTYTIKMVNGNKIVYRRFVKM